MTVRPGQFVIDVQERLKNSLARAVPRSKNARHPIVEMVCPQYARQTCEIL
jgi:hypothetical protein